MFAALSPHLDERRKRLVAGAVARMVGHGGITAVAEASGLSQATVSDGVWELESGIEPSERIRRPGGGRKPLTSTDPGLVSALLGLVGPQERGDPTSPLRWTLKSTRTLAGELALLGHPASSSVVGRILAGQGFSLQGNAKVLEGALDLDRDAQFRYINKLAGEFLAAGDPVISVDGKKKEQVGRFANPGRTWRPAGDPVKVADHDFPDEELGKVAPYGVYDVGANTGWVNVGVDHETAEFAVETIRRWWNAQGRACYPDSHRLLITADAGGSNAARNRLWKTRLAAFALEAGLEITVCHMPPGTSKWNKIEHRLFSHITMNWAGRPLVSHEVVLACLRATTTRTGLRVQAELDTGAYPTGIKISDQEAAALPVTGHPWRPDLNYTIEPRSYTYTPYQARPLDQPSPHLADLCHEAVTGIAQEPWNHLVTELIGLHQAERDAAVKANHADGLGAYPTRPARTALSMPDRLLATILRHRHGLPVTAIAALFGISETGIYQHTRTISALCKMAGHPIRALHRRPATLDDITTLATKAGTNIVSPT
jgi:hypothetical protein